MTTEFKFIQKIVYGIIAIGSLYLLFLIFKPFFASVLWAAILAALLYPVYNFFVSRHGRPALFAGGMIAAVLLLVIVPLCVVAFSLIEEIISLDEWFRAGNSVPLESWIEMLPSWITQYMPESAVSMGEYATSGLRLIGQNTFNALNSLVGSFFKLVVTVSIMLFALFFFLRDGVVLIQRLTHYLPFSEKSERALLDRLSGMSKATIKATLVIGIAQGVLGGIGLLIVGVPMVLLLTFAMIVLSVIPAVGATLVLIPAAVYLVISGSSLWSIITLCIFIVIVSVIDNILRPILVGNDAPLHPLLIILSTVGGLSAFGLSGFVFGPLIVTFALALLDFYADRYKLELIKQ